MPITREDKYIVFGGMEIKSINNTLNSEEIDCQSGEHSISFFNLMLPKRMLIVNGERVKCFILSWHVKCFLCGGVVYFD